MSATAATFVCFAVVTVVAAESSGLSPALPRVPANTNANTTSTPEVTLESTTRIPSVPAPQADAKKRSKVGSSPLHRQSSSEKGIAGTKEPLAEATTLTLGDKTEQDGDTGEIIYEELPVPMARTDTDVGAYMRDDGTYIVNDDEGVGCLMFYFKAKITIYYPDTKGDYQNLKVSPDEDAKVSGDCELESKVSRMSVSWASFILSLAFGLDDVNDTWFVSKFNLTYDLNDPMFKNAVPGMGQVSVMSKPGRKYWQTSNSRSFRCLLLHDVKLSDAANHTATLHFDEVRVQAFSSGNTFLTPKHCKHRVHRDEMVPVTVGGVLAGSTLLTVLGYGIFRYFKIKKVQYDIME